ERGARHAKRVDGRRLGRPPHHAHGLLRYRAERGHLAAQSPELLRAGQRAAPEQVGGLLEADPPGQLLQLVASDDQLARQAVDVAQAGAGGNDAVQPAWDWNSGPWHADSPSTLALGQGFATASCSCSTSRARRPAAGTAAMR